jgi:hypothetical protein
MSEEKSVHFVLEVRDASPWSRGEVACAVKAFAMQVAVITEAVGGPTVFRARVRCGAGLLWMDDSPDQASSWSRQADGSPRQAGH